MLSSDNPRERQLVTELVRIAARHTEHTALLRIGEVGADLFAIPDEYQHDPGVDYAALLRVAITLEPYEPAPPGPVSACALILPDRRIAYVKHGTAPMSTLDLGPNPADDPDTRRAVDASLTALLHIHLTAQATPPRPVGQAFPMPNGRISDPSPSHPPMGGAPPPPGRDAHGPRR